MDGRTDGRMDGWSDRRHCILFLFLFGLEMFSIHSQEVVSPQRRVELNKLQSNAA